MVHRHHRPTRKLHPHLDRRQHRHLLVHHHHRHPTRKPHPHLDRRLLVHHHRRHLTQKLHPHLERRLLVHHHRRPTQKLHPHLDRRHHRHLLVRHHHRRRRRHRLARKLHPHLDRRCHLVNPLHPLSHRYRLHSDLRHRHRHRHRHRRYLRPPSSARPGPPNPPRPPSLKAPPLRSPQTPFPKLRPQHRHRLLRLCPQQRQHHHQDPVRKKTNKTIKISFLPSLFVSFFFFSLKWSECVQELSTPPHQRRAPPSPQVACLY